MRWLINKDGKFTGETWDDGVYEPVVYPSRNGLPSGPGPGPGDEGFTVALINAELAKRSTDGGVYTADFAGVSGPPNTATEGEDAQS